MAKDFKDKTPPHDDELEQATLGSLLSDYDAVKTAIQMHIYAEDFYSRANMRIFEAIKSLDSIGKRPDIQTVVQELKQMGKLDEAGGASYVSSLTTVIPSSANIDYYIQMVKNYSLKRSLLKVASNIGVSAYDESVDSREMLEEIQRSIFKLSDDRQIFSERKIRDILWQAINKIEHAMQAKGAISGISSGFDELDQMTSGFQPDEFIVIGARPSVGKTALALNMASHIAINQKKPLAFFSLEMSDIALVQRLISSEASVDAQNIRRGFLSSNEHQKIIKIMSIIDEAPFHIVDMPNMKLLDLRAQARKMRAQQEVEIIFIDYLGLIGHENNSLPRYEQISEISRSLKSLARELHIPIVVLCQLTREAQKEAPTLAHLRDSGSIEQDADLVLFLNREFKKSKDASDQTPANIYPTDLIIAKQRNGPIGKIELQLAAKYAKFAPLDKKSQEKKENAS
ncbi:MAG: replicative DNA helicase [Treponema sp.]|nr:replicative DNA helicase [Treponema sp.]MCL2251209.1 replicative DNA helicase [Treponema sp.]